ncbi:MAG: Smr/MutS family protein [Noviherbaspirillum sp.]
MAGIKEFAALQALRDQLKRDQEARALADARRREQEAVALREANLFRHSVGTVAPLRAIDKAAHAPPRPEPIARHHLADEQAALAQSLSDDFSIETLLETDEGLSYARAGIGQETVRKLRRSHWVTQAQLDLHGMRTDEAREALAEFLRNATRRGLRCVRVIHGKGLGSVNREPVLKKKVRSWLVQKEEVLAFCQARAADGGAGAVMVLLKTQN